MQRFLQQQSKAENFPIDIKLLHDSKNSEFDVVFIHGLSEDREKTWTPTGASGPWPQTLLPTKIPLARILTFGYNPYKPNWLGVVPSNWIAVHAYKFLTALAKYRQENDSNERPLVFVCYCVGGLICELALVMSEQRPKTQLHKIFRLTRGVIFLATPHYGTDLVQCIIPVDSAGIIKENSEILRVLRPESKTLTEIRESFLTMLVAQNKNGQMPLQVHCYYAKQLLQGVERQIFPLHSARLRGYLTISLDNKDHISLVKCEDIDDTLFLYVCEDIRQFIKGQVAPTSSSGPLETLVPDSNHGGVIVDIVFVHGLGGDREATWTDHTGKVCWPSELLPYDIPQARILTFGYDTSFMDLADHAHMLLHSLSQQRYETKSVNRPIIFVTHSMGGLVCKDALLDSRNGDDRVQDIAKSTIGIVFLGTPHHGSGFAILREKFNIVANPIKPASKHLIRLLKPKSEVLVRIQFDFENMLESRIEGGWPKIQIICFYERLPTIGYWPIVSKDSATLPGYPIFGIDQNHRDIAKFKDKEDEGYKRIIEKIRSWVETAQSSSEMTTTSIDGISTLPQSPNQPQTQLSTMKILKESEGPAIADIVFIHGLGGNPELTWTGPTKKVSWPSKLLPLDLPPARILAFDFIASAIGAKEEISQYAKDFVNCFGRFRQDTQSIYRPIIFVAHGLGGLVCQDVLLTSRDRRNSDVQEIFKNTIGIAFLATPFRGSELIVHAMRAGNLLGFATPINKRILRVMKPYSEVLHRIQSDFQRMISSRTKSELPELHISCFYETLPLKFGLLVVPKHSAMLMLPGCQNYSLHKNHVEICKFESREDPDYQIVVKELSRWVSEYHRL